MTSSLYSVLRKLRVCCRYTLHFVHSVHEISGFTIKFFTFDIRWAVMSVSVNVEGLLLVFVQQRYFGSKTILASKLRVELANSQFISKLQNNRD